MKSKKSFVFGACLAAVVMIGFSGCEDDPGSGTSITVSGHGSTQGAYTATAGFSQNVYSGSQGTLAVTGSDTVKRNDGGQITDTGTAGLLFTQASSGYRFQGSLTITNIGGGNIGIGGVLKWKF